MKGPPRQFGLLLLLTAVVVLVLVGVLSTRNWQAFQRNTTDLRGTRLVLTANESLLANTRDAESSQRGYILTGKTSYLAPYNAAIQITPGEIRQLEELTAGFYDQHARAELLGQLIRAKLEELAETISAVHDSDFSPALAMVRTDRGNNIMDRVRQVSAELERSEMSRRDALMLQRDLITQKDRRTSLSGIVVLAFLLVSAMVVIRQGANHRERLISRLNASNEATERVGELLRTTLYSIGDAVITTDTAGHVRLMNSIAERLTGWPESMAKGQPIEAIFHIFNSGSRQPVDNPIRKVLQAGEIVGLANHTFLVSKSGQETAIDDSSAPIRNSRNEIVGVVLVFRDVTERKKAEAELQESEQRFRTMADAAPVLIWTSGVDRHFDYVNQPWLDFTGGALDQELGEGWSEGVHPEDLDRCLDVYATSFDSRMPFSTEYRLRRHDSQYRWFLNKGVPRFAPDGEFAGYIGCSVDVHDRRQNEEKLVQSAKLESLGVLAGGIAHDFNNILVGILGNASLLEDYLGAGTEGRKLLEQVIESSERAAQLVHQMLAYSGRGQFVVEPLELSSHARQIVALVRASIPKNISFELHLQANLPTILADAAQLQQLTMNLVINAAEAMSPRGGPVVVSTEARTIDHQLSARNMTGENVAPGEYIVLTVEDKGSGMDAGTLARIFDPFFTTKFTGRGLGLAAVLGIVRGQKGAITVDTAVGKGSTFQVFFPALGQPRDVKPAAARKASPGSATILVVDDEAIVHKTARITLEKLGYAVLVAENGVEALQIFERQQDRIALIVLDMTMPIMSGEETLSRLRSIREKVKIVASSGYNEQEFLEKFGNRVDGFLQKPYTALQVAEVVSHALAGSAASA
jgi:PAS domain S-box-containing protein